MYEVLYLGRVMYLLMYTNLRHTYIGTAYKSAYNWRYLFLSQIGLARIIPPRTAGETGSTGRPDPDLIGKGPSGASG